MSLEVMVRVIRTSKAQGADYLMLLILAERSGPHGISWPGMRTLARDAHLADERTARRTIGRLKEQHEVLVWDGGGRSTSIYWLRRYANPVAVDEFMASGDPRFADVRAWMAAIRDAVDSGGVDAGGGVDARGMGASPPGEDGGVDARGMGASPPGDKRKEEPAREPQEEEEPATDPQEPGGAGHHLKWSPLFDAISESFGGLRVVRKGGEPLSWAALAVGMVGRAAGDDLDQALRLWADFDSSSDREFVRTPERSLVGQLGSWLGRRKREEERRAAFVVDGSGLLEHQEPAADPLDSWRFAVEGELPGQAVVRDDIWRSVMEGMRTHAGESRWSEIGPMLGRVLLLYPWDGEGAVALVPDRAHETLLTLGPAAGVLAKLLDQAAGQPVRLTARVKEA